jgi:hypothetical protein
MNSPNTVDWKISAYKKRKSYRRMGGFFSPMKILPKYYGRKNALGEILLCNHYYMG